MVNLSSLYSYLRCGFIPLDVGGRIAGVGIGFRAPLFFGTCHARLYRIAMLLCVGAIGLGEWLKPVLTLLPTALFELFNN